MVCDPEVGTIFPLRAEATAAAAGAVGLRRWRCCARSRAQLRCRPQRSPAAPLRPRPASVVIALPSPRTQPDQRQRRRRWPCEVERELCRDRLQLSSRTAPELSSPKNPPTTSQSNDRHFPADTEHIHQPLARRPINLMDRLKTSYRVACFRTVHRRTGQPANR